MQRHCQRPFRIRESSDAIVQGHRCDRSVLGCFRSEAVAKFEIGNGGDGPERHLLPIIIAQGAAELLGAREGVVIAGMAVAIEDRKDLVESAGRNVLVPVALFEKLSRILDNLEGRRAQRTRIDADNGSA